MYVDWHAWDTINLETKKQVTFSVAQYFEATVDGASLWADIYDDHSGRKIAKWGLMGFSALP